MDNGEQVDTSFLDFEKAFDTPPHEFLNNKLFDCGIWEDTEMDRFFTVLQTTANCCKRSKIGSGMKAPAAPPLPSQNCRARDALPLSLYLEIKTINCEQLIFFLFFNKPK